MTIQEHKRVATQAANSMHVRWFAHFNYPCRDPWMMALWLIDQNGEAAAVYEPDLKKHGYEKHKDGDEVFWVIERTHDDGTPYTGPE